MTRTPLPNRRPSEYSDFSHGPPGAEIPYKLALSRYADGNIGEVFIDGPKLGSAMDAMLSDGAILASLALQYGAPPAVLAKSMSRLSDDPASPFKAATAPASPLGAAMDLLALAAAGEAEAGEA